jgi:hypothetical protein
MIEREFEMKIFKTYLAVVFVAFPLKTHIRYGMRESSIN